MKTTVKIMLFTFLLGTLSWLTEGVADYYTFHGGKGSIWDALIFVSPQELVTRGTVLVAFVVLGIVIAIASARRKRAEDDVLRSKRFTESVIDGLPGMFYVFDSKGNFLQVNKGFLEVSGYSLDEALGMHPLDFFSADEKQKVEDRIKEVFEKGASSVEADLLSKNGRRTPYYFTGYRAMIDNAPLLVGLGFDITERNQAQEALRESEEKFRDLVERTNDWVWEVDQHGVYTYASPHVRDLLGYEPSELIGKTPFDFMPDDEASRVGEIFRRIQAERAEIKLLENTLVRIDGGLVIVETNAVPIIDESGILRGYRGVDRDITERIRANEALLDRQARIDSIFRAAPTGIGVVVDRVITEVNDRVCQMTGYTRDELVGQSARIFYSTQADFDEVGRVKYEQIARLGTGSIETRFQRKDGSIFDVLLSSTPISPDDMSRGVTSTALDITERKRSEAALRESEEKYRDLVETTDTGYLIVDMQGRVMDANAEYVRLTGREDLNDILGHSVLEWTAPYDVERNEQEVKKCAENGYVRNLVIDYVSPEGQVTPIEIDATVIEGADCPKILALCRDIAERRQAENVILRRSGQLEILSRASRRLNTVLEVPAIMRALVASALELVDAEAGAAGLFADGEIVFTEYNKEGHITPIDHKFGAGYGVPGWVMRTMKTYVTNDAEHDPHVVPEIRHILQFYNLVDTPVITKDGKLLGVLEIHNTLDCHPFDEIDVVMLEGLAASAAIAIENAQLIAENKQAEQDKRRFYRDTIKSVTQGKLDLAPFREVKEYLDSAEITMSVASDADVAVARHQVVEFWVSRGFSADKLALFEVAAGEAITNAVKHAQEGRVYAGVRGDSVWVAVSDNGPGISTWTLPGAILHMGYSTKASMGMGYTIIMEASDSVLLCTGPEGTTVVLSVNTVAPEQILSLENMKDTWDESPRIATPDGPRV